MTQALLMNKYKPLSQLIFGTFVQERVSTIYRCRCLD